MQTLSQLQQGLLRGASQLKLSESLTEFPMEILTLADTLELLDLSGNELRELPPELAQCRKLKILFASNNPFEKLPRVLGQLPELEMVGFKSNLIKHVPSEALPKKLRWLILTDNQISELPESLGECHRLQKLALAGNQLTSLPASMAKLQNLELLRISANKLNAFPEQLLACDKLAWFAFAGNPFGGTHASKATVPVIRATDFTLAEQLGQGASGVISRGHWINKPDNLPDDIAVKVFKGEMTSDGYPKDELKACLQAGRHPNLVASLALADEPDYLALIMELIPGHFNNLGLPPSFATCTRDTYAQEQVISEDAAEKIIQQMHCVFNHLHDNKVCHGDLYAHNTLYDEAGHIIFGDFGAASTYEMLPQQQQAKIREIEQRALAIFCEEIRALVNN
ncbi:leucine-rich repeat-containing protein kinase family protein [Motilimonas pumila]|uniref:Protein kinase n=1 Tax=Motilimonas pumila TaxID=2303987 RepID=A0A418Y9X1_9GAMM|nr:leucine-rich repeat-containing protein kinase family protein [Motilimonas pumila]RJG38592.1 protein kinase [Motilimonas pumila]